MEHAVSSIPARRRLSSEIGLAVSIFLAVPLAIIVEGLALAMIQNAATWRELAVLGLFALPLLTAVAAIALSLTGRPRWLQWAVAALLLLVPPVVLLSVWRA